jgi:putative membrane protein
MPTPTPQHLSTTMNPSDLLAAERTYLAWLRTGLALMGFGFVVARFGLFLREIQLAQHLAPQAHSGLSLWFGLALVAMGVLMEIAATFRHLRLVRELQSGEPFEGRVSRTAIAVAILLAITGLALCAYLIVVR